MDERHSRVVRLRPDVLEVLRQTAQEEGISENEVIQRAIVFYSQYRSREVIPLAECMKRLEEKDRFYERLLKQVLRPKRKTKKRRDRT